jgi:hypothetical protein
MANRTIEFYGYAYGNAPVILNAHINGNVVFSGNVSTIDQPLPVTGPDMSAAPVLFSVDPDSGLFPDTFSGSYPMTLSIATGNGVAVANVFSNYMIDYEFTWDCETSNSSITGNVLTLGNVTYGNVSVGQLVVGNGVPPLANLTVKSGPNPDGTWILISKGYDGAMGNIVTGTSTLYTGNSTGFINAYNGTPTNSDNTADPRSSVTIDGVAQNPSRGSFNGTWTWIVPTGSTLACNLNVSQGNVGS